jgi:hypothetical protein
MKNYTTNDQGMLVEVEDFVKATVANYENYVRGLVTTTAVEDFSYNEMAFLRLVSSSSIMSMCSVEKAKNPKTKLEVLNQPFTDKGFGKPLTELAVKNFLAKLSPEKRKEILGF